MALVGARRCVEHDHAVVHVAVGDVELAAAAIDGHVRGCAEVRVSLLPVF